MWHHMTCVCVREAFVGYNWISIIGIVFVYSDGSCASMQFNLAFEALSLNNVDKLKTGNNKLLRFREQIIFFCWRGVRN